MRFAPNPRSPILTPTRLPAQPRLDDAVPIIQGTRQLIGQHTRTTSGSYWGHGPLLKSAVVDAERPEVDPATGQYSGVLNEGAQTYIAINSADLTTGWAGSGSTPATSAAATDIAGRTARRITSGTAAFGGLWRKIIGTDTGTHTTRWLVRKVDYDLIGFRVASGARNGALMPYIDLSDGSVYDNSIAGLTISASAISDYYMVTLSYTGGVGSLFDIFIAGASGNENGPLAEKSVDVAAPQLTKSAFAPSYMETESLDVARGADVSSISGAQLAGMWNPNECTIAITFRADNWQYMSNFEKLIYGIDVAHTTSFIDVFNNSGDIGLDVKNAAGTTIFVNNNIATVSGRKKIAIGLQEDNMAVIVSGGSLLTDTNGAPGLSEIGELYLGNAYTGGWSMNGHIEEAWYWPRRLPNEYMTNWVNT